MHAINGGEQVDHKEGNEHRHKAQNEERPLPADPCFVGANMEIQQIDTPCDECPSFFNIPCPLTSPSFICPKSTAPQAKGKEREGQRNHLIRGTQVQLLLFTAARGHS